MPNWCVVVIENVLLCIVDINLVNSIEMSSEQISKSIVVFLSTVLYYVSFSKIAKNRINFNLFLSLGTQYTLVVIKYQPVLELSSHVRH